MALTVIAGECNSDRFLNGISIIKTSGQSAVNCSSAAVIIGGNAKVTVKNALGVIIDGENYSQTLPCGIQVITCGISSKNTVSITSRTLEKLTLSLNRTIQTISGFCEPLEFPVNIPVNALEYDIMAAFAAKLLLSGGGKRRNTRETVK